MVVCSVSPTLPLVVELVIQEVWESGNGFFPNGTSVPPRDSLLTRERGTSFVALSRGSSSNVSTGLYRCEIPDVIMVRL